MISALATAGGAAGALAVGTLALGAYYPNAVVFGPVVGRGPRGGRGLYLTFDDGPNPCATPRILDILSHEAVPATFFMVGRHARHYPEVVRAVAAAGHAIGNHTDSHIKLHLRGPWRVRHELVAAHRTLTDLAGPPHIFRAPHGYRNPFVSRVARQLGYRVFGWTFGVWDTARPGAEEIRRRVRVRLRSGAIILLHDGDGYDPLGDRMQTADALPGIIRDAREQGYVFRSLMDLSARPRLEAGRRTE